MELNTNISICKLRVSLQDGQPGGTAGICSAKWTEHMERRVDIKMTLCAGLEAHSAEANRELICSFACNHSNTHGTRDTETKISKKRNKTGALPPRNGV